MRMFWVAMSVYSLKNVCFQLFAFLPFPGVMRPALWSHERRELSRRHAVASGITTLLNDLGDHAGAHGTAAFADRKPQTFLHRDRVDQRHHHFDVVARHHHLHPRRQLHRTGDVRRAEVELRTVALEERRVTTA